MSHAISSPVGHDGLADALELVLDKGVVIAGDVAINLVGIELLTIELRLIIASADKARELGLNWREHDPALTLRAVPPRPRRPSCARASRRWRRCWPRRAEEGRP